MDPFKLQGPSLGQILTQNQIRQQRQQRQQAEADRFVLDLGLGPCTIHLSNSASEKQRTLWLESQFPWTIDQGQPRIHWLQNPTHGSQPNADRLVEVLQGLTDSVAPDPPQITLHWYNFRDPVLDLAIEQLLPAVGAIVQRNQPLWIFDRQAYWCIELWPPELHWGQSPSAQSPSA
jgi:hypothetical protein